MLRVRPWKPPPHVFVHISHWPYALTAQSMGQACALQARVSSSAGHATPPLAVGLVALRVRLCVPAAALAMGAHDSLHDVQPDQPET